MCPHLPTDVDEQDDEGLSEREIGSRPERSNRPSASRRVKMRAPRRNRAADMARRGIHQRRNKRTGW